MISVCIADSFRSDEDERSTYYEKRWMLLGNYVKSKGQMWLPIMRREPELYDGNRRMSSIDFLSSARSQLNNSSNPYNQGSMVYNRFYFLLVSMEMLHATGQEHRSCARTLEPVYIIFLVFSD